MLQYCNNTIKVLLQYYHNTRYTPQVQFNLNFLNFIDKIHFTKSLNKKNVETQSTSRKKRYFPSRTRSLKLPHPSLRPTHTHTHTHSPTFSYKKWPSRKLSDPPIWPLSLASARFLSLSRAPRGSRDLAIIKVFSLPLSSLSSYSFNLEISSLVIILSVPAPFTRKARSRAALPLGNYKRAWSLSLAPSGI